MLNQLEADNQIETVRLQAGAKIIVTIEDKIRPSMMFTGEIKRVVADVHSQNRRGAFRKRVGAVSRAATKIEDALACR